MNFLVTGGAGFIGSHLVEELLADGHKVMVIDNFSTGRLENLFIHPQLKFIAKDILTCQPEDFPEPIDGIAHLAATASVPTSWSNPLSAHHNNLSATVWVIELCQRLSIPRLVYTSSAAVYGDQSQLPITEDRPTNPIAPYGWQKLFSEQYASLFAQKVGFSFIGLRLFNVFGPRQLPDSTYSGVISIFTKAISQGNPVIIYGDGQQIRDFVYVKDVAWALKQALTTERESTSSLVCNIGGGTAISLIDLVKTLQSFFPAWDHPIQFKPERPGDIKASHASIAKASAEINYLPKWDIESGLQQLVKAL